MFKLEWFEEMSAATRQGRVSTAGAALIVIVIVFVIATFILYKKTVGGNGINWGHFHNWKHQKDEDEYFAMTLASKKSLENIDTYVQRDCNFDRTVFCEQVRDLYIRMQRAWENKDLSPMKPYFMENLYSYQENRLSFVANAGRTSHFDELRVISVEPKGWCTDVYDSGQVDLITIRVTASAKEYITDDATQSVINGSPRIDKKTVSEWVLRRSSGMTSEKLPAAECPSCHAPTVCGVSECAYCGAEVRLNLNGWMIHEIRTDNL